MINKILFSIQNLIILIIGSFVIYIQLIRTKKYVLVYPDLWVRSANLTPDPNSVLSRIGSHENWIRRFRQDRIIIFCDIRVKLYKI